jgi:hypothetical protein
MSTAKWRIALTLLSSVVVAGVIVAVALALSGGGGAQDPMTSSLPGASAVVAPASDGSTAKFAFLARQTSNSCGLQPSAIAGISSRMRMQGSCCFPMNLAAYKSQVRGLRASAGISEIPRDPYDVPVSLVKRLLAYNRAITLSPAEAQIYSHAMHMSRLKGPCCCHCWRWYAFRGLSKHLIADLRWRAARIAALTELLEGCGGPAGSA